MELCLSVFILNILTSPDRTYFFNPILASPHKLNFSTSCLSRREDISPGDVLCRFYGKVSWLMYQQYLLLYLKTYSWDILFSRRTTQVQNKSQHKNSPARKGTAEVISLCQLSRKEKKHHQASTKQFPKALSIIKT